MTRDLNDRRVADRDPAHVLDRHRLLVIRQRVGRHATHRAQRAVQPDHHARQRLVAQRHHHPKPRPRQPRAEQHRPRSRRPRARRRNPTAATTPAAGSTAASAARACSATGASPPRPPAASCDTTPHTPSRPAPHAPHPRAPARESDRPAHRSSPRTDPPTAAAAPAPAARHPPPPAPRPAARPSCDHTPPAPPLPAATPSRHTPPRISIASSGFFTAALLRSRVDQQRALGVPAPQDRTVGRNRGHPWGETVATSGAFRWPPTGSFPWPPSLSSANAAPGRFNACPRRPTLEGQQASISCTAPPI